MTRSETAQPAERRPHRVEQRGARLASQQFDHPRARDPTDLATIERLGPGFGREIFTVRTDNHLALGARDPDLVLVLPGAISYGFETWIAMHEDLRRVARVRTVFDHLVAQMTTYAAMQ